MRKKKMTKEEINAEIDRQVKEEQKKWLEEKSLKAEADFVEKTMQFLVYKFKFDDLSLTRTFSLAKAIIDAMESEEAKSDARHIFAEDLIYVGATGDKLRDRESIKKTIEAIEKYLVGQT